MSLLASQGAIRSGLSRRPEGDFYATPARCTEALLRADPPPPGAVWEPACGDGAIARVLTAAGYEVTATDLHDRGYGEAGADFLKSRPQRETLSIVTNPPFNLADDFALHALGTGAPYVAMFQRLAWLEGAKRYDRLWGPRSPSRVWVFSSRQTLWRGDDPGKKDKGGAIAFAWFVWVRSAPPGPRLGWLQTRDAGALALSLL